MTEVLMGIALILYTVLLWEYVKDVIQEDEEDAECDSR